MNCKKDICLRLSLRSQAQGQYPTVNIVAGSRFSRYLGKERAFRRKIADKGIVRQVDSARVTQSAPFIGDESTQVVVIQRPLADLSNKREMHVLVQSDGIEHGVPFSWKLSNKVVVA